MAAMLEPRKHDIATAALLSGLGGGEGGGWRALHEAWRALHKAWLALYRETVEQGGGGVCHALVILIKQSIVSLH